MLELVLAWQGNLEAVHRHLKSLVAGPRLKSCPSPGTRAGAAEGAALEAIEAAREVSGREPPAAEAAAAAAADWNAGSSLGEGGDLPAVQRLLRTRRPLLRGGASP